MRSKAMLKAGIVVLFATPSFSHAATEASLDLVQPITDYKIYVTDKTQELVDDTKAFTSAIKDGDLEKARALYAPTRMHYEAIEPIAELFSDLDVSIDARADDYEKKEEDPAFTGFHRIEYGLWEKDTTDGLEEYADRLMSDVETLNERINDLTFPPAKVVGGAAALMEEVAATKISGEEDRYSHTDLWDFKANFDGSQKIFNLVQPMLETSDPQLVETVSQNFTTVGDTLAKYKTEHGYELYDKLTDSDRTVLAAKVNSLAEDLSTIRGTLGLD